MIWFDSDQVRSRTLSEKGGGRQEAVSEWGAYCNSSSYSSFEADRSGGTLAKCLFFIFIYSGALARIPTIKWRTKQGCQALRERSKTAALVPRYLDLCRRYCSRWRLRMKRRTCISQFGWCIADLQDFVFCFLFYYCGLSSCWRQISFSWCLGLVWAPYWFPIYKWPCQATVSRRMNAGIGVDCITYIFSSSSTMFFVTSCHTLHHGYPLCGSILIVFLD